MTKTYKFIFYRKERFTGYNNNQDNFKRKNAAMAKPLFRFVQAQGSFKGIA
jgi:hypothetical protein